MSLGIRAPFKQHGLYNANLPKGGGTGWTGATTCVSGSCCTYQNDWYSQCLPCSGGGGSTTTTTTSTTSTSSIQTTTTTSSSVGQATGSFTNPVLWEDLADNDVFRVGDAYYYTASNMHYSPGAPILRSYDLAHWEYIGHAVPTLSWSPKYDLANGQRAYVKGTFASTMRYRASNGLWYWIGCIEYSTTYVYTASSPTGPWTKRSTINTCLYDCGLLIDDNDTMWVAYGNPNIYVAQLSSDGLSVANTKLVYTTPTSIGVLEGSRFYKRNGRYYIAATHPANAEYVLQASSAQGSYSSKVLVNSIAAPVSGAGNPHQGSLVDTPSGQWYYMGFIDAYPGGRMPVLAPITWGADGFPSVTTVNGAWGQSYPYTLPQHPLPPTTGTDSFSGTSLGPAWEWNHNPDTSKFAVNNGLRLSTATVTTDLYQARNTLTHRIHGPNGVGTVVVDVSGMADGDRAGLALFRDQSGWVGVMRDGAAYKLAVVNGIAMNSDWTTSSTGSVAYSTPVSATKLWLRISASIAPGAAHTATFSYSTDGNSFVTVGPSFTMTTAWQYFMGKGIYLDISQSITRRTGG